MSLSKGTQRDAGVHLRGALAMGGRSEVCGIKFITAGSGLKKWFCTCKVFQGIPHRLIYL